MMIHSDFVGKELEIQTPVVSHSDTIKVNKLTYTYVLPVEG